MHADPEGVGRNDVCVVKRADDAAGQGPVGGLLHEIATEQQPSTDLSGFEILSECQAIHLYARTNCEGKAKPAGIAVWCYGRKDKAVLEWLKTLIETGEVGPPSCDELWKFCQLRDSHGSLHVSEFEVVANV